MVSEYHIKKKAAVDWWLSGSSGEFPEYPGASLTEGIQNYSSSIDPDVTNLNARYYFPTGATNLPMLTCVHGYEQIATDIGETTLRRFARMGYFVVAVEMRGSTGSGGNSGTRDIAGREKQDVYEAEEAIKTNFAANLASGYQAIWGMSGGGGVAWNMLEAYPDRYNAGIIYFGISDYISWYNEQASRQASLQGYIGGTPVAKPDEYNTRNARLRLGNIMCHVSFCHDTGDASVGVSHSQAMRDLYVAAGRTDYYYNESTVGSTYRWSHASPDSAPDLIQFEGFWKNRPKTGAVNTVATSGTLKIPGRLHTKRFQIWANDGNYLTAGKSRYGTVVYDTVANSYEITNDSTLDAVFTVVTQSGLVGVAAIASGGTKTITPVSIVVDGNTPVMWFDAGVGRLDSGSDCKIWCDKTGGPQFQGYSLRNTSGLPAVLSSDLNSLPAVEFVAASSEYLEGERRRDLQNVAAFTLISVTTGAYIGHAQSANNHIQQALSGTSFFMVVANGSNSFGSYAGASATYLVRSMIFDGSQGANATRLVARENKSAKTLSFTGTIPATTENAASVFRLGRRAYDTSYLGGKVAEFMIFNTALADVGDKEDILKAKYSV